MQQDRRTHNPFSFSPPEEQDAVVTFVEDFPIQQSPTLFTEQKVPDYGEKEFVDAVELVSDASDYTSSFSIRSKFDQLSGEGARGLRSATSQADDTYWIVVTTHISIQDILTVYAEVEYGEVTNISIAVVSEGYPENVASLSRWTAPFGFDQISFTRQARFPNLSVEYDQTKEQDLLSVNHFVGNASSESIGGLIIDNPVKKLPDVTEFVEQPEKASEVVTGTVYGIYTHKFDHSVDRATAQPEQIYCPLDGSHSASEGYGYCLNRLSITDLSPVYAGKRVFNIDASGRITH